MHAKTQKQNHKKTSHVTTFISQVSTFGPARGTMLRQEQWRLIYFVGPHFLSSLSVGHAFATVVALANGRLFTMDS